MCSELTLAGVDYFRWTMSRFSYLLLMKLSFNVENEIDKSNDFEPVN